MTRAQDVLELDEVFRQVKRKITAEWNKHFQHGISGSQAIILEKLAAEGPQKATDLADALYITSGAVTGLSDKLIMGGYANRNRAEDDRRVVYLEITEKGNDILETVRKQRKELIDTLFNGLPEADLHHLIRIYREILSNIEKRQKE